MLNLLHLLFFTCTLFTFVNVKAGKIWDIPSLWQRDKNWDAVSGGDPISFERDGTNLTSQPGLYQPTRYVTNQPVTNQLVSSQPVI